MSDEAWGIGEDKMRTFAIVFAAAAFGLAGTAIADGMKEPTLLTNSQMDAVVAGHGGIGAQGEMCVLCTDGVDPSHHGDYPAANGHAMSFAAGANSNAHTDHRTFDTSLLPSVSPVFGD